MQRLKENLQGALLSGLFLTFMVTAIPHTFLNNRGVTTDAKQYAELTQNQNYANLPITKMSNERANSDFIYLTDINYIANQSHSGWNNFEIDKAADGTKLTVHYEDAEWEFDRGIWAHAKSWLVYDLQNYSEYDYFTAFVGLNKTAYNNSNGVRFTISVSNDGQTWIPKWESDLKKGTDNADFVQVEIKNYRYLKLYADDCGGNGSDHSVYADAKLIKEGYKEYDYDVKSLAQYDKEINEKFKNAEITENPEYEKLVLQRYLVKEFGEYGLKRFLSESAENRATWEWLTNDVENLRMYIMGGKPDGSYYNSLLVLKELLNTTFDDGTKLIDDFKNTNETKYKRTTMGNLYKKMAITLSLTHSTKVALWMNPNVPENQSNAVTRYKIYKDLYNNDKFKVSNTQDQTKWFEGLEIEEMRYVMNNIIDDEEILWLNEYTQKRITAAGAGKEEEWLQPHHYMKYIWPDYSNPTYYDPAYLAQWDAKYDQFYSKYHITYKTGVEKLWMNIEHGAVCGGISKIGSNIRGVHGTPSSVINQPGHAAIIYWRENADGLGYWAIDNDVSNWSNSNKTEKLEVHMPLGWGDQDYLKTTAVTEGVVNYVLLAQAALNDYPNYEDSRLIYLTAALENNHEKKLQIYEKAVEKLSINIDAWDGIIEEYKNLNKTDEEYLELAKRIFENLKYYPLPMYHLSEEILDKVTESNVNIRYQIIQLRTSTLESVTKLEDSKHIQAYAIRVESNYLLNKVDSSLATFSFDGENANSIVLSENYKNARWDYCLDGDACIPTDPNSSVADKKHWNEVLTQSSKTLDANEISKITQDTDIYVHVVGVNYSNVNLYKIDIQKPAAVQLYANDLENRVMGTNMGMEWRIIEDESGHHPDAAWVSYNDASPTLTGTKKIEVRTRATGVNLKSDSTTLEFSPNSEDKKHQYIPISKYSIENVSTEATGQQRYATNAIDGNLNTNWHSAWNGSDKDKFIVIKLNRNYWLSALDYVPSPQDHNRGNGLIWQAKIEFSENGTDWTKEINVNWEDPKYKTALDWRHADFSDYLGEGQDSIYARYIKITGIKTNPLNSNLSFMVASMFNFYQDASIPVEPSIDIAYSNINPTKENVVTRAINLEDNIEVTALCHDNSGTNCFLTKEMAKEQIEKELEEQNSKETELAAIDLEEENEVSIDELVKERMHSYTFVNNGTIYYQYRMTDEETEKYYYEKVTVDNIDRTPPEVTIKYNKTTPTNQDVTAVLESNEPIKVHTGVPVQYDQDGNVIMMTPDENGEYKNEYYELYPHIHTFTDNHSFVFEYEDLAGNEGKITATVNWIDKKVPFASITYSVEKQTYDKVVATLMPEAGEKLKVLNNDGKFTYTFEKNGSFEFTYQDEAGNISTTTANVDWIVAKPEEENKNENNNHSGNSNNNQQNSHSTTSSTTNNSSTNKTNTTNNNNTTTNNSNTLENASTTNTNTTTNEENTTTTEQNNTNTEEKTTEEKKTNTIKTQEQEIESKKKSVLVAELVTCTLALATVVRLVALKRKAHK